MISLWHPNQRIDARSDDPSQGAWIYWVIKNEKRLLSCIGLQTLMWYRDNRFSIPKEWEGKTICAWKSVIIDNVQPVLRVQMVPVMFVEPEKFVLRIEWKNLLDFFSPDHMTPIITA